MVGRVSVEGVVDVAVGVAVVVVVPEGCGVRWAEGSEW